MVTPELIGYIKGEFAKGRTRDAVHNDLVANGGWSEVDLNEAFRSVLPMNSFTQDSSVAKNVVSSQTSSKLLKIILAVIIVALFGFAIWFYRIPLLSVWNAGIDKLSGLFVPLFNKQTTTPDAKLSTVPITNPTTTNMVDVVRDCGVSVAPDIKNPSTYQNDAVLSCLGNSAILCEPAKAVLNNSLFPTIFEVVKNQDVCNFRLSYDKDSALSDITGKKLALQYISCPVKIVKAVDESKNPPLFSNPDINNPSKYASQIYFYGTLGLFIENNIDQNKINAVGCGGDYISTVLASYRKTQSKN